MILKRMALVEVRNATKIYQTEGEPVLALQDISLEVEPGEVLALVGKSGCGKSTLLNLCGAMDFPTSGEVLLDGEITTRLNDAGLTRLRREKIGFIFQSFQLLHTLTAVENVELPLLLARRKNVRSTARERLRWVAMEDYADRLPHQLSGGEQQRVAIARALVHDPRVLLADEPTGNLDTSTGEIVLNILHRSAREFGVAVLLATHSVESSAMADRVMRLRDGQIVETNVLRGAGQGR
jgi:ABC-type lipoprotein export system ATPase subunit